MRPFSSTTLRAKSRNRSAAATAEESVLEEEEEDDDEELVDKRFTTQRAHERTGRDRLPRDHEITDPLIMVKEHDEVQGPLAPGYVLSRLSKEESLRMVRFYLPADPKQERYKHEYAVAEIVNKREEFEREKERAGKERRKKQAKTKEVEITWNIGEHDLQTKLTQIGKFLAKGNKVEVILGKKRKKGKTKGPTDAEGVLKMVREALDGLGGRETKTCSGEVGEVMRLFVEEKPPKKQESEQQQKADETTGDDAEKPPEGESGAAGKAKGTNAEAETKPTEP
ncbi:hypothetical protein N3K66_007103 [Trichothecium roseum]|uniref:Uncharacterized protein n=1 Tax=Trichothecium roseum TaxID=47278 RepID=A0ACC0UZU1_9HYPO|nr:hypothetical protein N3K66_007103 [Trichothecium roseum]